MINDFAFMVDILSHLNELNTKLQGNNHVVSELYHRVGGFMGQLVVWEGQLKAGEVKDDAFPTLKNRSSIPTAKVDMERYAEFIEGLKAEFERRFQDLKNLEVDICLFSCILISEPVPTRLQMEVIDLRHDLVYSSMFKPGEDIRKAYQGLLALKYPRLKALAAQFLYMFGSTYCCEQLFSSMGYIKNKYRSRITNNHLADVLHNVASDLKPNFEKTMKDIQCQGSH